MTVRIEIELACPNCKVSCWLEDRFKRKDGYYEDSCWNCGYKFPLVKVELKE